MGDPLETRPEKSSSYQREIYSRLGWFIQFRWIALAGLSLGLAWTFLTLGPSQPLAVFSLLGIPTIIFYGFLTGIGQNAFLAFPQFLGAILGRRYFRARFGQVKWRAYAPILMAGYGCGVGLIGMTTVALKLISSAVKQTIF